MILFIITFSVSYFCTSFFSIKVIFGRVITFYIKKGSTVLQLYFICCISCINIAEECFAFVIKVTLYIRCLLYAFNSVSLFVLKNLFMRRDHFMIYHISSFEWRMFLKRNVNSSFEPFLKKTFPNLS